MVIQILELLPALLLHVWLVVFPANPIAYGCPVRKRFLCRRRHAGENMPKLLLYYMAIGLFRMGNVFRAPISRYLRNYPPRTVRIMLRVNKVANSPEIGVGAGAYPYVRGDFRVGVRPTYGGMCQINTIESRKAPIASISTPRNKVCRDSRPPRGGRASGKRDIARRERIESPLFARRPVY